MIGAFVRQQGWELRKLAARPRTWLGFAASLLVEIVLVALYRATSLEDVLGRHFWRIPGGFSHGFSGLTAATYVTAETMVIATPLFLALVAGDIVANELEERTLHMILARPVSRGAVLAQKLVACCLYTIALALFVGATSLGLALAVNGPGSLVMVSARESIIGVHEFSVGLRRYGFAMAMLAYCCLTFTLLAFMLSCWRMKPGAATVTAAAIVILDQTIRVMPGFVELAPYSLTTRLLTWRQAFHDVIPWLRIERNLSQLFLIDVALITAAWLVFRRREVSG